MNVDSNASSMASSSSIQTQTTQTNADANPNPFGIDLNKVSEKDAKFYNFMSEITSKSESFKGIDLSDVVVEAYQKDARKLQRAIKREKEREQQQQQQQAPAVPLRKTKTSSQKPIENNNHIEMSQQDGEKIAQQQQVN